MCFGLCCEIADLGVGEIMKYEIILISFSLRLCVLISFDYIESRQNMWEKCRLVLR